MLRRIPGAAPMRAGEIREIAQQQFAVFAGNRFGVELHAPLRAVAMPDTHDHAVRGGRGDLECLGQWPCGAQRVVAHRREVLWHIGEQLTPVVGYPIRISVPGLGAAVTAPPAAITMP